MATMLLVKISLVQMTSVYYFSPELQQLGWVSNLEFSQLLAILKIHQRQKGRILNGSESDNPNSFN